MVTKEKQHIWLSFGQRVLERGSNFSKSLFVGGVNIHHRRVVPVVFGVLSHVFVREPAVALEGVSTGKLLLETLLLHGRSSNSVELNLLSLLFDVGSQILHGEGSYFVVGGVSCHDADLGDHASEMRSERA